MKNCCSTHDITPDSNVKLNKKDQIPKAKGNIIPGALLSTTSRQCIGEWRDSSMGI
jgi:hypothetical protein